MSDSELRLLNRDWANKKAVAAIGGKIVFTNGPELYVLLRSYDNLKTELEPVASGDFLLLCGNLLSLVVDRAESQEMRMDGISTTNPQQMYYDIVSNPNMAAKYIEKSEQIVYKRREQKRNDSRT